jgi:cytochrome c-type biogenesis protein CcmH
MWGLLTKGFGRLNSLSILMNRLILLAFLFFSIGSISSNEEKTILNNDAYPFESETKELLFYSLLTELRCPKCQSSNLSGSNSPISNDLKREVYELVLEGNSSEQIKSHLVKRYGNFIIYNPPVEPTTYVLWFGPFILVFIASLIIFFIRKRASK